MAIDLAVESISSLREVAGANNSNFKQIEQLFDLSIVTRNGNIHIIGEDKLSNEQVRSLLEELLLLVEEDLDFDLANISHIINMFYYNPTKRVRDILSAELSIIVGKKQIVPRSLKQQDYIMAIRNFGLSIAIGPAGTGKTYIAIAEGLLSLMNKEVSKIVLARPVVEAGERLGFLPGTLEEKIDPYLRPLYDALFDILGYDKANGIIERNQIEIAPLAYMRGRTFDDSFMILDEAQNATKKQMKLFLTRLGSNSKVAITGDITQIDLEKVSDSGLIHIRDVLRNQKQIRFVEFTDKDVVRHPLVKTIIQAYDDYDNRQTGCQE
ncbi:MAG: PhoH family protein [Nitrospinota bacterium]